MGMIQFNGEFYHDDRLFVLYLCKGTDETRSDHVATTIYHENPPPDALWCIVTYRNVERYVAVRVDIFESKKAAVEYMRNVEPTVPLISLGGTSPKPPLNYDDFVLWKKENGFKEYDYKTMYKTMFAIGGVNPTEVIYRTR
ncbi:hypothetical protein ACFL0H_00050 [Thermodesulfobacteriota bacterium]